MNYIEIINFLFRELSCISIDSKSASPAKKKKKKKKEENSTFSVWVVKLLRSFHHHHHVFGDNCSTKAYPNSLNDDFDCHNLCHDLPIISIMSPIYLLGDHFQYACYSLGIVHHHHYHPVFWNNFWTETFSNSFYVDPRCTNLCHVLL